MNTAIAMLALCGCYVSARPGFSAPVGRGHGGAGFDLGVAVGGEYVDNHVRIGGGLATGARLADRNGHVPIGIDGHVAVRLTPYVPGRQFGWLAVAHVAAGYAEGLDQFDNPAAPASPNGVFADAFLGLGVGSTMQHRDSKVERGHLAAGLVASRFELDGGGGFWLLGAALELSFGWLQQ